MIEFNLSTRFSVQPKMDDKQLGKVLENLKLKISDSKETKLYNLFQFIQTNKDLSEEDESILTSFFLKAIKYTTNRIMIEVPITMTSHSIINNENDLYAHFSSKDKFEINMIMELIKETTDKISDEFMLIYRHANFENRVTQNIELVFVRKVEYSLKKNNMLIQQEKYEYVWCDVNLSEGTLCIFISNNRKSIKDTQVDGNIHSMKEYFSKKLSKEYDFNIGSLYDGDTLFKMYRELTSKAEGIYQEKLIPYENTINQFVDEMKNKLNINLKDDIGLANRVSKLFERNLIQKDFDKIVKDPYSDGRVISLDFKDDTGSSVKATAGGVKFTDEGMEALNMEDSDVYFDTKETIHSIKNLGILVIEWNVEKDLPNIEDRYKKPKVTYIAYKDFYVCSIQRVNLDEEVSNYVLSKFSSYRNIPL